MIKKTSMKSLAIIKFYGKKYTMNKALIDITYTGCLPLHCPFGLHIRKESPCFRSYPGLHLIPHAELKTL